MVCRGRRIFQLIAATGGAEIKMYSRSASHLLFTCLFLVYVDRHRNRFVPFWIRSFSSLFICLEIDKRNRCILTIKTTRYYKPTLSAVTREAFARSVVKWR